ncbi:PAS domain S-box protein [Leptolyngbya sp. FACHB-17]|uniref:PAS domain S-box protein n=1 Tax=unclassified Leptolyngbya TaxID=2650499 RepID=UPI0018EF40ED|nr:PAS domain S-box protein [Leptolyngbya sp. FACHB-17]
MVTQFFLRYVFAIATTVLALLVMLAIDPLIHFSQASFLLFLGAVVLSAFCGGRNPGLAATVLAAIFANYFFLEPQYTWSLTLDSGFRLFLFALQGLLISFLIGALQKAQEQSQKTLNQLRASEIEIKKLNQELQHRVEELTLAERSMRANEERLRVALKNAPIAVFNQDRDLIYTWIYNPALDYQVDEVIGKTDHDLVLEQEAATLDKIKGNVLATGIGVREEVNLTADGKVYSYDLTVEPLWDSQDAVVGITCAAIDITERKRAEAALQESEERYRQLTEASPQIVWTTDASGMITYFSPGWYDYTRLSEAESMGAESGNALHPEDRDCVFQQWSVAVETVEAFDIEIRLRRWDGVYRWFLCRALPVRDANGAVISWVGTDTDIDDQKQIQEALRQSEERLSLALQSAQAGMWQWFKTDDRMIWSEETFWMLGYEPRQCSASHAAWIQAVHPDDREMAEQAIQRALNENCPIHSEYRVRLPDGSIRWLADIGQVTYDEQGNQTGVIGIQMNITDRKQAEDALQKSEHRFRSLAESNVFGVAFGDFTGNIQYVNDYFLNLVGYTREEIETGQVGWRDITPTEYLPLEEKALRELRMKGVTAPFEKEYIRKDGTRVPILIGLALLQESYNQQQGLMAFHLDLTEPKQAEAEREISLQQAQAARAEAETANRIKDEFLAVLSHELRSPLNPILGWATLLQSRPFEPKQIKEALQTIERNARLQNQLIDDLLDIAKILRGKLNMNDTSVDRVFVIEAAIETVTTAANAKSIQLCAVLPHSGQVSGDTSRLQQIVWNLLSNAIKFTPTGGQVEIRLEQVGNQAQITVSDTGKGISAEFLPYIFETFRQEDASITRKYGGLGLGLAIVRHLVEAHGGTITAESPGEGQGAIFSVRLPLLSLEPARELIDRVEELDLTGIRILTVDDEPDARELVNVILTQYGAEVLSVASAKEGLAALGSFQPDVLVSDIGMPETDGFTLLQQVRALSPEQGGQIPARRTNPCDRSDCLCPRRRC